jgi:hypothetical protein
MAAMKPDVAERLAEAGDLGALTQCVLELCEPYGPVHSFRVVHNRGASRVACFIELESVRQQPALARALGTGAVNGAVCFDVQVRRDFGAPGLVPINAQPALAQVAR